MAIKPGGLLDKLTHMAAAEAAARICESCGNLILISDNAQGCAAHDKLILPDYPPYHTYMWCPDWAPKEANPCQG